MTEHEVLERLKPLMVEALGVRPEQIEMDSELVYDLGAESIDLLDLSFLVEQEFGITLESNGFERQARSRLGGADFEVDGYLTEDALREMRVALPEVRRERIVKGLRKADVPSLLTVAVFVHLIQRRMAEKEAGHGAA